MNLSRTVAIIPSTVDRRGGVTTTYYAKVNTADCEGVMFLWLGSSHAAQKTAKVAFHLQGSSYSSAGWANIGSTVLIDTSAPAAGFRKKVVTVDCHKPTRKWVRLAVHHSTGDMDVVAIKYGLRRQGSTDVWSATSSVGPYALSVSAT